MFLVAEKEGLRKGESLIKGLSQKELMERAGRAKPTEKINSKAILERIQTESIVMLLLEAYERIEKLEKIVYDSAK